MRDPPWLGLLSVQVGMAFEVRPGTHRHPHCHNGGCRVHQNRSSLPGSAETKASIPRTSQNTPSSGFPGRPKPITAWPGRRRPGNCRGFCSSSCHHHCPHPPGRRNPCYSSGGIRNPHLTMRPKLRKYVRTTASTSRSDQIWTSHVSQAIEESSNGTTWQNVVAGNEKSGQRRSNNIMSKF